MQTIEVSYDNDKLDFVKDSKNWQALLATGLKLDKQHIRISQIGNNSQAVTVIPILDEPGNAICIYRYAKSFLIVKAEIQKLENGNQKFTVLGLDNQVYYSFEMNSESKVGNFYLTKNTIHNTKINNFSVLQQIGSVEPATVSPSNCSDGHLSWNDCVHCLIVMHCGGNWVCIIACGSLPLECAVAAAYVCFAGNPSGDA